MRTILAWLTRSFAVLAAIVALAAIVGTASAEDVTGLNVKSVQYPGGVLFNASGKTWTEQNKDGKFTFEESLRYQFIVNLIDNARKLALQIDLFKKKVFFAPFGEDWKPLYNITSVSTNASDGTIALTVPLPKINGGDTSTTMPLPKTNGTGVATTLPVPKPAGPSDGFVWSYSKSNDGNGTLITLGYGMPETDAQQLYATCVVGAGGAMARMEIGADVGKLKDDANVKVQFIGGSFNGTYQGSVSGTTAEEGITGVTLFMELEDPFWAAMGKQSSFTYKVIGHGTIILPLGGAKNMVNKFVQECQNIPDTGVAQNNGDGGTAQDDSEDAGQDEVGAGKTLACDVFPGIKTPGGDSTASVTFTNDTDMMRSVMWIDFKGQPQPYFNLDPGQSQTQPTSAGAVWMMTDGPGNCAELYVAPAGNSAFHMTAEVNDGGD